MPKSSAENNSEPVVLGTASITGDVPLHLLPFGEHRIRAVGIRSLSGVNVDADGEAVLSRELIDEIQQFDAGTVAAVLLTGPSVNGGMMVAVRVVPLEPQAPWWSLLLIVIAAGVVGRARRRDRPVFGRSVGRASSLLLIATVPAVVHGWYSTVTRVAVIGMILAVVSAVVLPRVKATQDTDATDRPVAPEPV